MNNNYIKTGNIFNFSHCFAVESRSQKCQFDEQKDGTETRERNENQKKKRRINWSISLFMSYKCNSFQLKIELKNWTLNHNSLYVVHARVHMSQYERSMPSKKKTNSGHFSPKVALTGKNEIGKEKSSSRSAFTRRWNLEFIFSSHNRTFYLIFYQHPIIACLLLLSMFKKSHAPTVRSMLSPGPDVASLSILFYG